MAAENEGTQPAPVGIDSVVDKYFGAGAEPVDTQDDDAEVDGLDSDEEIDGDEEDLDLDQDEDSDDDDDTDSDEDEELDSDEDDEDEDDDEDLDLDDEEDENLDEDEEEDDESDADEIGQKLTKKQREEIENNPALRKLKGLLQADYTRKRQADAQTRKQMEADRNDFLEAKNEYDKFEARLKDPVTAQEFFVDLYLQAPEFVEKALERAQELHEDPEAKERYEEKRDLARDKEEIQTEKQKVQQAAQLRRVTEIRNLIGKGVKQAKLDSYAAERIEERVIARIARNASRTGKREIDNSEVVEIIKDVRRIEQERLAKLGKVAKSRSNRDKLRSKQEEIRHGKRRSVPTGRRSASAGSLKKMKVPEGVNPTDFRIDQILGTGSRGF